MSSIENDRTYIELINLPGQVLAKVFKKNDGLFWVKDVYFNSDNYEIGVAKLLAEKY